MVRRSDGRWQEQIPVCDETGRVVSYKYIYGKTKKEIYDKIAAFKAGKKTVKSVGRLFTEVADEWWERKASFTAPQTQLGYKAAFNSWYEHFKNLGVAEIKPPDINEYLYDLAYSHGMAYKTAKNYLSVCRLIFRYAVQLGYCDSNPAAELEVPKNLQKGNRKFPTDEEIKKVKCSYDAPFGDIAYWCLYTGMRRGELLALRWEDIDMENRTIIVNKSISRDTNLKNIEKTTKTENGVRVVPILDRLYEKMKPSTGLVFPNAYGEWITPKQFEHGWDRYQRATGVTITPHSLRHAYATMLYEANVPDFTAQRLLGHANISTTKDIYTHLRKEHLMEEMASLRGMDL